MNRHQVSGSLGESDSSEVSETFGNRARTSTRISNNRRSRTAAQAPTTSANAVRGASRRKRRIPRKMHALKEIKKMRTTTQLAIPKLPFARLVREITLELTLDVTRYTRIALEALQEAAEIYIVQLLEDAYYLTAHRKCVTLSKGDLLLLQFLQTRR